MGKFMKQYDKENMKIAMLQHEETFRQQVHELHRLYRVQKILMNDIKAELKRQRVLSNSQSDMERWNAGNDTASHQQYCPKQRMPHKTLDLHLPAEEYIEKDGDIILEIEEESNLDLTLATGNRRTKDETSATADSGASFSSSSEFSGIKLNSHGWGMFQMNNYQSERKSDFDVENRVRQDRMKQSPWLLQCLSFNMI